MKVAVLSESPADEAALRILVDAILGIETEPIDPPPLRSRGWPSVRNVMPTVIKHLYYQTDADAFLMVADSNGSPVHQSTHEVPGGADEQCRLCKLRQGVTTVRSQFRAVATRRPLRIAVGLAVPAIEAWYRCGIDPHATEAAWDRDLQSGVRPRHRIQTLKQTVYETERPPPSARNEACL